MNILLTPLRVADDEVEGPIALAQKIKGALHLLKAARAAQYEIEENYWNPSAELRDKVLSKLS